MSHEHSPACHGLAAHRAALLTYPGVTCVYVGPKNRTGPEAVVVGVRSKVPPRDLAPTELIPAALRAPDGAVIPTDVVETGDIVGPRPPVPHPQADVYRTSPQRPCPAGVSLGHYQITAGTLGLWVRKGGALYALTNNHVANSNQGKPGDPVLQPGPYDGGTMAHQLGALAAFVPIEFPGADGGGGDDGDGKPDKPGKPNLAAGLATLHNLVAGALGCRARVRARGGISLRDAAVLLGMGARGLATLDGEPGLITIEEVLEAHAQAPTPLNEADCALVSVAPELVSDVIYEIGRPRALGAPALGQAVQKSGRTTDLTKNVVTGLHATVQVSYGDQGVATFVEQAIIERRGFSAGGDSGSAIVTADGPLLVGLLFAGSDTMTIFSPIEAVARLLGFTL